MDLFPYALRKNQENIMRDIRNTLDARKHFVFESGTGSGKTICVLSSTLQYALENNKKIVYATRTNAQQRQVILELRAIRKKMKDKRIFGLGIQGRTNMCILAKNDPEIGNGTSEELSKFCSNQKKKVLSNKKNEGCKYYRKFIGDKQKIDTILEWTRQKLPTAEEFVEYCKKNTVCPYEMNKALIREAVVIVVPYIYIFDKTIRIMLFDWLSTSEDDILLVVDEAHNLPDYLRDLFSAQLSAWMLNGCVFEAEKVGDPSIANGKISVSKFCKILLEIVNDLRDTYVYGILENGIRRNTHVKSDAFIPSHELESEILSRLKITSITLRDIISDLIAYGEKIQDYRQKEGKLPRSYIHKLGIFLEFWITVEMDRYIKLVVDSTDGKNPRVEAYCLDPSIGTGIINEFHSSIHMSGTLKPLEEYRDSLGLSQYTELVFYPSPFSRENRRIFFTRDVTTRYEEIARDKTIISRMWQHITNICNTFPKNTMVFFPSFNILSMFRNKGYFTDIERCLYVEEQAMSQSDLMDLVIDFKRCGVGNSNGAALFSVIGGRISEGMDFPAEQLEIAVIVGIPYPKPTARQRGLQRYYDLKFGKGWEYTVNAPAARKLLQSIGRLIRDENDRGVAVVLDKRAPRFKQYISDMRESKDLLADISSFMNR
ncbi:MAG: ATP-dependent DNA helicase [Thermoplasmatales archaeon]|nr:ATP-dependent DNA helicase [Thermoplasmatales archaeon]